MLPWRIVRVELIERTNQSIAEAHLMVARADSVCAKLEERSNQTADRLREALDRAEKAEDFCRRLTASMVKLKMHGGNVEAEHRPARIFHPPPDDATIAKRAAKEEFLDDVVSDMMKNGAPSVAEAREEARRIYNETFEGIPGT